MVRRPFYLHDAIKQMDYDGAGSFFIVLATSLFVGMALALQLSAELSMLGLQNYTGRIVGISVLREIGPVLVGIIYAGRVGSGMASELGSMVLGHQIDTLRVFGVDPIKKLVTPRIMSSIIMLPMLTIIGDATSLIGSFYISLTVIQESASAYWNTIRDILTIKYVLAGVLKPFAFGYIIACIGCYTGLSTKGGATGLRISTTNAFVASILMIIIADFVLTKVILFFLGYSV
jgi:phospholipid/cholesterol/gamma-HCH transport system permease protein